MVKSGRVDEIFTARLRGALDKSPLTRRSFAGKIGVTESTVQRWLTGESFPTMLKIQDVANALKVTPQWLFGADEIEPMRDTLLIKAQGYLAQIESVSNLKTATEAILAILEADKVSREKKKQG